MKKSRRVFITLELETSITLKDLKSKSWWWSGIPEGEVLQVSANVSQKKKPAKKKKKVSKRKRK